MTIILGHHNYPIPFNDENYCHIIIIQFFPTLKICQKEMNYPFKTPLEDLIKPRIKNERISKMHLCHYEEVAELQNQRKSILS